MAPELQGAVRCGAAHAEAVDVAATLALYERMLIIREAERACGALFAEGAIPGFIHLSDGQEAVSVGVMAALGPRDTIASTHRGHGHALAKGLSLEGFFKELMGKADGACKGRGGSMHVADLSVGMLGANGIVGAGVSIATGSGLAHKLRGGEEVAVAFFGDGALAEGVVHECLNIASLMGIPTLFACENNGWSEFSPTGAQIAFTLEGLAKAHRVDYRRVDGADLGAVADAAAEIVASMRRDRKPAVLECVTIRTRGHYEGDAQRYRGDGAAPVDPLLVTRAALESAGVAPDALDEAHARARAEVAAAVEAAKRSTPPSLQSAAEEVYARGEG
jgi:pyruvate dehydrogenase E1 component alpha subunit